MIYLDRFPVCVYYSYFVFFKQKTAYEMRISDWSSDVCSSVLRGRGDFAVELSAAARDVQGRPRAARGQYDGAQALAVHAALDPQVRRAGEGSAATRRAQYRQRRRRAWPLDDGPYRLRQDQLHRLDRDRAPRHGIGGADAEARDARARRQRRDRKSTRPHYSH